MPKVSPQWVEGRACPHCGRPLTWIGHWRPDRHSPEGQSFQREPFTMTVDKRIARDDRETKQVVSVAGRQGKVAVRYEHTCTMQCGRCSLMYSESQALHVPPPPPESAPAGYYLLEP